MISRSATFPRDKKKADFSKELRDDVSYRINVLFLTHETRDNPVHIRQKAGAQLPPVHQNKTPRSPPFPRILCALAAPSTPERRGRR